MGRAVGLALLLWLLSALPAAAEDDYELANGRFYPQAGGFSITDEAGIPLWSEYRRLGGADALGFPISGRFEREGRVFQAAQRGILEWRAEEKKAVLVNVLDDLSKAGRDDWLLQTKQTPRPASTEPDAGKAFEEVVKRRQGLLDADEAIKKRYFASPDPLTYFGLPTSGIQDMGNHLAVRLQRGVIQKWKVDVPWARAGDVTLANVGDLAKEAGLIPKAALESSTPVTEGRAERTPWSGWWWPADEGANGAKLFDKDGPLARYDALSRARKLDVPSLRDWEYANVRLTGGRYLWAGHCNGWAAAAVLEAEPTAARSVDGVTFSVADQKGLLSSYHFADRAQWIYGDDESGVAAQDFHRQLVSWIGGQRKAFIVNTVAGTATIDNRPAYRYRLVYKPDEKDPSRTHVRATLWFVDYEVDPDFVGVKHWPSDDGKLYEYVVVGDRNNPSGGAWEGVSTGGDKYARPWRIWYPDPTARDDSRPLTSPDLDYKTLKAILEVKPEEAKTEPKPQPKPAPEAAPVPPSEAMPLPPARRMPP